MKSIFLIFLLLISWICSANSTVADVFAEANKSFEQKNYSKAVDLYGQIVSQDYLSPQLFLNYGNAYFQLDELAMCILQYEKGLKYFPNDKELNENLLKARDLVETTIFEVPDFFLLRIWNGLSHTFPTPIWAGLQILFLGIMALGLYHWLIKSVNRQKRIGFNIFLFSTFLFIVSFCAGQNAYDNKFEIKNAIVSKQLKLYDGPDYRSNTVSELSEGVKVELLDEIGSWYMVELLNQQIGYIEKKDLLEI